MERFEYKIIDLNSLPRRRSLIDALNAEGAMGWELISISQLNIGTFKRSVGNAHTHVENEEMRRAAPSAPEKSQRTSRDDDREKLRQEMEAIAREKGLSLGDILDNDLLPASQESTVKFQDPDHPENTWTGRGRMPKWLARAIAEGTPKEAYRVRSTSDTEE